MSSTFGLSSTGFTQLRQTDWQASLQAAWQAAFGTNVNLDPRSVNGQIIGIMAERFALLSEGIEQVYQSQYPNGAEGIAVDNILALNGLTRLPATATVTQPTPVTQANGVTLYGLVLYGTPGTVVPAGTLLANTMQPPAQFSLDQAVVIGASANALQSVVFSNAPTQGSYTLALTAPSGAVLTTGSLGYQALAQTTLLQWATVPTSGSYALTVGSVPISGLAYNTSASSLAAAINAALSTTGVQVTGTLAAGMAITWPAAAIPLVTASSDASAPTVVNPVQAAINALVDPSTSALPFTDVTVTASGTSLAIAFGSRSPSSGQPSSGAQAVPLITVASTTLQAASVVTNISVVPTVQGSPAEGVGTATCTATGPMTVKAATLTVVASPVAGLTGVTNQLDCISGQSVETDTQAMARRAQLLSAQAQGPLAAVLQAVKSLPGVTAALAFSNTSLASQQMVTVPAAATSGTFQLFLGGGQTTALPYNVTATALQAALQAIPGFANTTVVGTAAYGYTVDFQGALGGQSVPLMIVANNTTGQSISVTYGRPPKSIEVVVQGGSNQAVATAIYKSTPAGISTYGTPVLTTTASVTAGSTTALCASTAGLVPGLAVSMLGIPQGTTILSVSGSTVTLSAAAGATYSNTPATFSNSVLLLDSNGTPLLVQFSRPTLVPIYVNLSIVSDTYLTPGVPSSGRNPNSSFSPGSIPALQSSVAAAINQVPIGGTVVGLGTNGLLLSFSGVAGIVSFTMTFGTSASPSSSSNVTLLPEQQAYGNVANVQVSYT